MSECSGLVCCLSVTALAASAVVSTLKRGRTCVTKMLCSPQRGDSAVIIATTHYHLPVLKELVRAGADLNLQNEVTLSLCILQN